jgi:hypothetical protein
MERSRMLIILVVLWSGLVGRAAETNILEPASKLAKKQPWSAKPSVPEPQRTLAQALPDMWPDPGRGCPQQGPMSTPVVTSAAWVVLREDDEAQQN